MVRLRLHWAATIHSAWARRSLSRSSIDASSIHNRGQRFCARTPSGSWASRVIPERRRMATLLVRLLTAMVMVGTSLPAALAQTVPAAPRSAYPVKPIRIVVGLAAGGVADVTARTLAQKLSEQLGQAVVVENRTGAGTSLAIERVANATADGYTLLLMGSSSTVQSAVRRKVPYDVERDFAPISLLTNAPYMIVVHPSLPVGNIKQLIALARAQPGKLNYGSNGMGSTSFLAGALFNL